LFSLSYGGRGERKLTLTNSGQRLHKDLYMETQTSKQPTCGKEQTKTSWSWKIKSVFVFTVKAVLRYLLVRPATWRWLQVHVPEAFAKVESMAKEVVELISGLF
jgi:hypothetical protein